MNEFWVFSNAPSSILLLDTIHIMNYINELPNLEPTLHFWDNQHLIMVYCFLNKLLDSVC